VGPRVSFRDPCNVGSGDGFGSNARRKELRILSTRLEPARMAGRRKRAREARDAAGGAKRGNQEAKRRDLPWVTPPPVEKELRVRHRDGKRPSPSSSTGGSQLLAYNIMVGPTPDYTRARAPGCNQLADGLDWVNRPPEPPDGTLLCF